MKPILFLAILFVANSLSAQYTYPITADTVKLVGADSSELVIKNHTQAVPGFLFNTGNGRTVFRRPLTKLSDSSYLVGADSLKLRYGFSNTWLQGGNTFGANAKLGTYDRFNMDFLVNGQMAMRLDTNGAFLLGLLTRISNYSFNVGGPCLFSPYMKVSIAQNISTIDIVVNPTVPNAYGTSIDGSQVTFYGGAIGVNKATLGNIPANSFIIGVRNTGTATGIYDYSKNYEFVVDSTGTAVIHGGYDGVISGGSLASAANSNAYTLNIEGPRGTGSGSSGDIILSTGNSQTSGTTIHTLTNRWWIKGNTGYLSNSSSPTSILDLSGSQGYSQLALRASFTASSSSDTHGSVGNVSWDDGYLYIKTSSGWKRSALSSF